jgi:TatD DNase family protein
LIDFHCHVDLFPDPLAVLSGIEERNLYVLAVTTTPKSWKGTRRLIGQRKRVRVALGLHPELAGERAGELPLFEHFLQEAEYVGEIGLDGSAHVKGSFGVQERVLLKILQLCRSAGGRIMSLHTRRAANDVLDLLAAHQGAGTPILHWFSGTLSQLERANGLGCWYSVGPKMLGSTKGRGLAAAMPKDRVLTETDSPFAKDGSKPLMPWEVSKTYPVLAEMWNCSEVEVEQQLRNNLRKLARAKV